MAFKAVRMVKITSGCVFLEDRALGVSYTYRSEKEKEPAKEIEEECPSRR